ncbi:MAG TPA: polysaccharide biosynthesis C-terminal domain-containing protein [Oscillospiraceae bacterium]|nr:polysaccharide biosynthesis C-terminal domain-containing protein [Oscillospiraceae bacterium]
MNKLLDKPLGKLKETGFFHIFSSQVLIKIVSFCSGLFIGKMLKTSGSFPEYGIYTDATVALNLFLLLTGLGTTSAMLQFGSENYSNQEKKQSFLSYGLRIGLAFNILMIPAILIFAQFILPGYDAAARPYLMLLAFMPVVVYINDVVATNLRIDLKNKAYSYFNTVSTILIFAATLIGAGVDKINGTILDKVKDVIVLRYVAYALTILFILIISKDIFAFFRHPVKLVHNEKILFLKISIISAINNGISALLNQLDTFLVGVILKNSVLTGIYSFGSLIPSALLFIPQSIMTYVYPYFARHNSDIAWVKKQYIRLFKIMLVLSLAITVGVYFLVPPMINVFFDKFNDCIPSFRILVISFFFAAVFKMPSGTILVTLKKVKINFYLAIAAGVINLILDLLFIKTWGIMGAAIATLITNILTGACSTIYLQVYLNRRTPYPISPEKN